MAQDSNKQPGEAPPRPRVLLSAAECESKEEFKKRAKVALRVSGLLRDEE